MDRAGDVVKERFAVVYAPTRGAVEDVRDVLASLGVRAEAYHAGLQAARAAADPQRHRHAALVAGPSTSSESQQLYYLVRWLD